MRKSETLTVICLLITLTMVNFECFRVLRENIKDILRGLVTFLVTSSIVGLIVYAIVASGG